jgi:hypothetical protein
MEMTETPWRGISLDGIVDHVSPAHSACLCSSDAGSRLIVRLQDDRPMAEHDTGGPFVTSVPNLHSAGIMWARLSSVGHSGHQKQSTRSDQPR